MSNACTRSYSRLRFNFRLKKEKKEEGVNKEKKINFETLINSHGNFSTMRQLETTVPAWKTRSWNIGIGTEDSHRFTMKEFSKSNIGISLF